MMHSCATCCFLTVLPGAKRGAGGELETIRRGVTCCVRFPEPMKKELNDWCGEHPAVQEAVRAGHWRPGEQPREPPAENFRPK